MVISKTYRPIVLLAIRIWLGFFFCSVVQAREDHLQNVIHFMELKNIFGEELR